MCLFSPHQMSFQITWSHNPYCTVLPITLNGACDIRGDPVKNGDVVGTKCFSGQWPYHTNPAYILSFFRRLGFDVIRVEKIIKWSSNRRNTGCFHVYCSAESVDPLCSLNRKFVCHDNIVAVYGQHGRYGLPLDARRITIEKSTSTARHPNL